MSILERKEYYGRYEVFDKIPEDYDSFMPSRPPETYKNRKNDMNKLILRDPLPIYFGLAVGGNEYDISAIIVSLYESKAQDEEWVKLCKWTCSEFSEPAEKKTAEIEVQE